MTFLFQFSLTPISFFRHMSHTCTLMHTTLFAQSVHFNWICSSPGVLAGRLLVGTLLSREENGAAHKPALFSHTHARTNFVIRTNS